MCFSLFKLLFKSQYQYCVHKARLKISIWKWTKKYWKNQSRTNIDIFSQISIFASAIGFFQSWDAQGNALAAKLDTLVFQLLRQRSIGTGQFSDTALGIIAIFSSPSSSEQQSAALRKLKNIKEVVDAAASQPSPIIKKWLQRSDSNKAVEKRILGFCQHTNFDTWPDAAQLEVDHIFQAEPSTIIVENAFKELRSAEKGETILSQQSFKNLKKNKNQNYDNI